MKLFCFSTSLILPLILTSVFLDLCLAFDADLELGISKDGAQNHLHDIGMVQPGLISKAESSRTSVSSKEKSILKGIFKTQHKNKNLEICSDLDRITPRIARRYDWKIYYDKAQKVLHANVQIPVIFDLVKSVIELGNELGPEMSNFEEVKDKIFSGVTLAHRVLQLDSLENRERLWVLGVLSCLKSTIPCGKSVMMSGVFQHCHLDHFRGDLELFLLKDIPLGEMAERMWPETKSLANMNAVSEVISEALQRASTANWAHQYITTITPQVEIQELLYSFIHLNTPIDDSKALELVVHAASILKCLEETTLYNNGPDQAKVMTRFLLHLQENHLPTRIGYIPFVKNFGIVERILQSDIDIQLEDKSTDNLTKKVYILLKGALDTINLFELTEALIMMMTKNPDILQLGRLLRVLETANMEDEIIYHSVGALLHQSKHIAWIFGKTLEYYYPGEYSDAFSHSGIMALILRFLDAAPTEK